ncbi:MAG: hypothetical protein A2937_01455 [Candidatus Yonathbacteria bacterium RIFCSPLOWO2_01_FULL_47_33b]|uniref:Uncharacterized protein n=1 Tax=Candidatus Yonathbacteria bacterium RIFCSPLOWO2_01_FULL_47_33b TaxID=1802727 RepID=A0A1G2SH21_9BACT|nr:MAG: hypothetical protein A2937_01455 [Candidatus Yonathbacteria bacterium RIFCSPLOWO2_01_FULL_47_33b]
MRVNALLIQLRMRANGNKSDYLVPVKKYRAIVSCDINTATAGICFVDRVVVKDRILHILKKKIPPFLKSIFDFLGKFCVPLLKMFL